MPRAQRMRDAEYRLRRGAGNPSLQARIRRYAGADAGVPSRRGAPPHHSKGLPLITFNLLVLIGIIGGILALVDGIWRLRARGGNTIVGVIEIIVAALFILSFFVPVPWGSLLLGVATLIVLAVALFLGGRTGRGVTIAGLIVVAGWIVLVNHWLVIPGIN